MVPIMKNKHFKINPGVSDFLLSAKQKMTPAVCRVDP